VRETCLPFYQRRTTTPGPEHVIDLQEYRAVGPDPLEHPACVTRLPDAPQHALAALGARWDVLRSIYRASGRGDARRLLGLVDGDAPDSAIGAWHGSLAGGGGDRRRTADPAWLHPLSRRGARDRLCGHGQENQPTLFAQIYTLHWNRTPAYTTENTGYGRIEAPHDPPRAGQVFLIER
jgi:hypothetical protein